mmetsp:Transcript_16383/g.32963  ORF Transcript_16383/g.32963 Transcript_16383/m.32963 type:complete len:91 (+) Transcript_16383:207-479(+)
MCPTLPLWGCCDDASMRIQEVFPQSVGLPSALAHRACPLIPALSPSAGLNPPRAFLQLHLSPPAHRCVATVHAHAGGDAPPLTEALKPGV